MADAGLHVMRLQEAGYAAAQVMRSHGLAERADIVPFALDRKQRRAPYFLGPYRPALEMQRAAGQRRVLEAKAQRRGLSFAEVEAEAFSYTSIKDYVQPGQIDSIAYNNTKTYSDDARGQHWLSALIQLPVDGDYSTLDLTVFTNFRPSGFAAGDVFAVLVDRPLVRSATDPRANWQL